MLFGRASFKNKFITSDAFASRGPLGAESAASLVLLGALVIGCSKSSPPPVQPIEPPGSSEELDHSSQPPPQSGEESSLPPGKKVSFSEYLERVQEVRQLEAQHPVRALRVAEDDLLVHVEEAFRKELPDKALRGTEDFLVALGVVPPGFDFEKTMLGLLRTQLAGLYDPRKETLFVREELAGEELQATLFHELVHALQDQTYDLDEFSTYQEDGTDRSSALSALAEGDATSAMYDAMLDLLAENKDQPRRVALDLSDGQLTAGMEAASEIPPEGAIPRIIRRSLIAPYRDGIVFVHELRRRGGWDAVNRAWQNPPDSTEQVLHIERFLARETPIVTPIVGPPSQKKWKKILSDVWGEQSLRLIFEEMMTRSEASSRAAGWGGDRIAAFRQGNRRAVTWHLIADDRNAAKRYLENLIELAQADDATVKKAPATFQCRPRKSLGPLAVARRGKHVILLAGPYREVHENSKESTTSQATCSDSAKWMKRSLRNL